MISLSLPVFPRAGNPRLLTLLPPPAVERATHFSLGRGGEGRRQARLSRALLPPRGPNPRPWILPPLSQKKSGGHFLGLGVFIAKTPVSAPPPTLSLVQARQLGQWDVLIHIPREREREKGFFTQHNIFVAASALIEGEMRPWRSSGFWAFLSPLSVSVLPCSESQTFLCGKFRQTTRKLRSNSAKPTF